MRTTKKILGILGMLLYLSHAGFAQKQAQQKEQKKEGKIRIELRADADGEQREFKKNYDSREEMLSDEDLKDFLQTNDLQAYFFGQKERPGFFSYQMPGMSENQMYLFKADTLDGFKYDGDTSYYFTPDFGKGYVFPLPRDPGIHFWLPFHPDSMFAMPLKPFELDSIRKHWESESRKANGNGFFYSFDDGPGDLLGRLDFIPDKKVSISVLKKGEEVLFGSIRKMDELAPESVSYFPNPGNGRFTLHLELSADKPLRVSILGVNGEIVYDEEVRTFDGSYRKEFDLREKEEGMYLLRVIQGNKQFVRKIIIN